MAGVLCVGHAVQDFVFAVPALPVRAGKYRSSAFDSVGGGPAATAAVTIARLGGVAHLAARLGADPAADLIVDELQRYGVQCENLRRFAGCTSSISAVLVDAAGERLIVNHRDERLPPDAHWLPDPRALGVTAVLADSRWAEGAAAALSRARSLGLLAILDADVPVPRLPGLLRGATHVAFSADGLAEYSGDTDPVRALRAVSVEVDGWCCVTVGAAGVYTYSDGVLTHHSACDVPVVDTLGAGDVWHGAFALALAEGRHEGAAVRFANAAAALKVQRFGGRAGVPTRQELEAFLTAQS